MSTPGKLVQLTRSARFAAAHRYYRADWSAERNRETFGPNVDLHGHNYLVEVTVVGRVDPETGMSVDLSLVDSALATHVTNGLGQRDLSEGVKDLEGKIPTTENLALLVWQRLSIAFADRVQLKRVRVYESPDLFVDYEGSMDSE